MSRRGTSFLAAFAAVGIPVFVALEWIRETCRARHARQGGDRRG